jgi:hypothetical protein
MKRNILYIIIALIIGAIYGISIHKYKIFPYEFGRKIHDYTAKQIFKNTTYPENTLPTKKNNDISGPWSIGVYTGSTPFDLSDPENISNPVITAMDINDVDAQFVADPFMVVEDTCYYIFFEILNKTTNQGDIGYAESKDAAKWKYKKVILDEKFHLSYPHIFKWENDYYLIPESEQDFSVRLYKASSFPEKWDYLGNLVNGFDFADPTIFRFKNKWWLFVSNQFSNVLNLFYSDNLLHGWKAHPMNPIIKGDMNISRPGGRVIIDNGHLYRFTQDDDPEYGLQVFAFEITDLSETSYKEIMTAKNPIVKMSGEGWNAVGMHQADLHKIGNKWIAAVDGRDK